MGKSPDKIDLQIIETLRLDGRTPNKSIAKRLNVSETTIASRIRAMTERNVMRVTLQRDIYSLGYEFQGFLDLYVAGRDVDEVAREVCDIEGVLAVAIYLGSPDIFVSFGACGREDLSRIIDDEVAKIRGVQRLESYVALEIRKFQSSYVALGKSRVAD
jgi:DNA-binding Lrp family transcriptional regulator